MEWNGWQPGDTEESFCKRRMEFIQSLGNGKPISFKKAAKKLVEMKAKSLFVEVKIPNEDNFNVKKSDLIFFFKNNK